MHLGFRWKLWPVALFPTAPKLLKSAPQCCHFCHQKAMAVLARLSTAPARDEKTDKAVQLLHAGDEVGLLMSIRAQAGPSQKAFLG